MKWHHLRVQTVCTQSEVFVAHWTCGPFTAQTCWQTRSLNRTGSAAQDHTCLEYLVEIHSTFQDAQSHCSFHSQHIMISSKQSCHAQNPLFKDVVWCSDESPCVFFNLRMTNTWSAFSSLGNAYQSLSVGPPPAGSRSEIPSLCSMSSWYGCVGVHLSSVPSWAACSWCHTGIDSPALQSRSASSFWSFASVTGNGTWSPAWSIS